MVVGSTHGPFAAVIYHCWSSSPVCPAALGHRRQLGAEERCLLAVPAPAAGIGQKPDKQGKIVGKQQPRGCSDPGRSGSLGSRFVPVTSPGRCLAASSLSPSAKRVMEVGLSPPHHCSPRPSARCCHNDARAAARCLGSRGIWLR